MGVYCEQMAEVVVLWGIFLLTQQLKSRYHNCTWQYFTIFGVQVLFLLAVTAYSVRCAASLLFLRLCNSHTAALSPSLRLHAVVHLLLLSRRPNLHLGSFLCCPVDCEHRRWRRSKATVVLKSQYICMRLIWCQ